MSTGDEAAKLTALQAAAEQGWADVAAGRYIDLADDDLDEFIAELGARAAAPRDQVSSAEMQDTGALRRPLDDFVRRGESSDSASGLDQVGPRAAGPRRTQS